jgi:hypothetical protein
MEKVIIYNQESGIPAVVIPTKDALRVRSIIEIAIKDVPAGKPFGIVNMSDLPKAPQETWSVPDSSLTDGIGGIKNEFY